MIVIIEFIEVSELDCVDELIFLASCTAAHVSNARLVAVCAASILPWIALVALFAIVRS